MRQVLPVPQRVMAVVLSVLFVFCPFAAYAELLRADLQRLQDELAEHTGRTPDTFAYPYGKYGDLTDTVLRDMGFQATLTCDWGVNHITRDPACLYRLGRICRSHNQSLQSVLQRAMKATA